MFTDRSVTPAGTVSGAGAKLSIARMPAFTTLSTSGCAASAGTAINAMCGLSFEMSASSSFLDP